MSENEYGIEIEGTPILYVNAAGGEQIFTTEGVHTCQLPRHLASLFTGGGPSPFEEIVLQYDGVPVIDLTEAFDDEEESSWLYMNMPTPTPDDNVKRNREWDEERGNMDLVPVDEYLDFMRKHGGDKVRLGVVRNGEMVWEDQKAA